MYLVLLYLAVVLSFREKYLELKKLHENEEGQPEKGIFLPQCIVLYLLQIGLLMHVSFCVTGLKKVDGVMRFFSVLQDLHDSHLAVEEEQRSKNKNNFLLELQT